jgi:hypothetical protein
MIALDDPRHPRRIDHWGNDGGDAVRPGPDLGNVEITELRMLLRARPDSAVAAGESAR